ncbi:MAG: MBL fold metallo-hydrolase [Candidatus Thermoplasmatota archaeon]|nr:MBL fold metallo-hydrolase [Candidatus Thermoplasmatota archaeon]
MAEIENIGHSTVMIKTDEKTIYIDPFYADSLPKSVKEFYEEAEKADVLLITHGHHDHCDPSTFKKLLDKNTKIVAPEICSEKIDRDLITVKPGDTVNLNGIEVRAVHAYNRKRKRDSGEPFHPKGEGVGYLIDLDEKTVYHPGDTEKIPEMENFPEIDTAFLPIDGTYTMKIDEAVEAAKIIRPNVVIPFHERDVDPEKFRDELESETKIEVKLSRKG